MCTYVYVARSIFSKGYFLNQCLPASDVVCVINGNRLSVASERDCCVNDHDGFAFERNGFTIPCIGIIHNYVYCVYLYT